MRRPVRRAPRVGNAGVSVSRVGAAGSASGRGIRISKRARRARPRSVASQGPPQPHQQPPPRGRGANGVVQPGRAKGAALPRGSKAVGRRGGSVRHLSKAARQHAAGRGRPAAGIGTPSGGWVGARLRASGGRYSKAYPTWREAVHIGACGPRRRVQRRAEGAMHCRHKAPCAAAVRAALASRRPGRVQPPPNRAAGPRGSAAGPPIARVGSVAAARAWRCESSQRLCGLSAVGRPAVARPAIARGAAAAGGGRLLPRVLCAERSQRECQSEASGAARGACGRARPQRGGAAGPRAAPPRGAGVRAARGCARANVRKRLRPRSSVRRVLTGRGECGGAGGKGDSRQLRASAKHRRRRGADARAPRADSAPRARGGGGAARLVGAVVFGFTGSPVAPGAGRAWQPAPAAAGRVCTHRSNFGVGARRCGSSAKCAGLQTQGGGG